MTSGRSWVSRMLGPFVVRPHLIRAILFGAGSGLLLSLPPLRLAGSTRAALAWNLGCVVFIAAALANFRGREAARIRETAAAQDEGQGLILGVVLAAAAASLGVVAFELSVAKDGHGLVKAARVALAFATVTVSWFLVQLVFALHYAHEFYIDRDDDPNTEQQGGLGFPATELPDYWDFLHFSVVIGVASQTADIAFTSRTMRRIGTVHSLVAFAFNTVVLALTINLAASLF